MAMGEQKAGTETVLQEKTLDAKDLGKEIMTNLMY